MLGEGSGRFQTKVYMSKQSLKVRLWTNTSILLSALLIVGAVGIYALWNNVQAFGTYGRYVSLVEQASAIESNILNARLQNMAFYRTNDDATAAKVESFNKVVAESLATVEKMAEAKAHQGKLDQIHAALQTYTNASARLRFVTAEYVKSEALLFKQGAPVWTAVSLFVEKVRGSQDPEYIEACANLRMLMAEARIGVLRFMSSNSVETRDAALAELKKVDEMVQKGEQYAGKHGHESALQSFKTEYASYKGYFGDMVKHAFEKWEIINGTTIPVGAKILELGVQLRMSALEDEAALNKSTVERNNVLMRSIISVLVIAVIIATIFAALLANSIVRNIQTVIEGLATSSQSVGSASGEIASSSQALAEASSEQAATVEETSASMEEISSMVKTNTTAVEQVSERAVEANKASREGLSKMHELEGKLTLIREAGSALREAMSRISQSSKEVAVVASTIDEIAFQTNLLSLNAAVEAARAGEAGAGFAVVAGEVGQLAQRSASNATQTTQLIGQAAESSKAGVVASDEVIKSLGEATLLFEEVTKVFNTIATQVEDVSRHSEEVKQASTQQAAGIDQINTAVSQLDQVIQQNAATSEESAGAAAQLSTQADQLRRYVEQLKEEVYGTRGLTSSFEAAAAPEAGQPRMFPEAPKGPAKPALLRPNIPSRAARSAFTPAPAIKKGAPKSN